METSSDDDLCEKIINEIDYTLCKYSNLTNFEIIPTKLNQNKSPVIHIENNLGLESWCVPFLYNYAHKTVLAFKPTKRQFCSIVKYLNIAALINPDVSLYWNYRRILFEHNQLNITREFHFSALVLSKKAKSAEAFAYRRWLYLFLSGESRDLSFEISLCERYADRSSSNYHAWSHRLWVLEQDPNLLRYEFQLTEKFIRRHISDYSCLHHRIVVLRKLWQLKFFDLDDREPSYNCLVDLIADLTGFRPTSDEDVLRILVPHRNKSEKGQLGLLRSFLYCSNLAACDLKLIKDLQHLFGEREAFQNYRRSIVQFLVEVCFQVDRREDRRVLSPLAKVIKLCDDAIPELESDEFYLNQASQTFLPSLCRAEALTSEQNRQWCKIFLNFELDN